MWLYLKVGQPAEALTLLEGLTLPEDGSAMSGLISLIKLAVQVQNGAAPEPELAARWLNELSVAWSSKTRQYQMSESAAAWAGLQINP